MRFILVLALAVSIGQQQPPAKPVPTGTLPVAPATPPPQGDYEFVSDLGAFLVVVKSDKTAAFESAMARLKQALAQSTVATRKQQAAGWRVLKSTETPTEGAITYLFLIDPVVKQASYDPIVIMRESLPNDVQSVYDQLKDSWVSATRIGLKEVMKMGGS